MHPQWLDLLRSPITHEILELESTCLKDRVGVHRFPITQEGIPVFVNAFCSEDGLVEMSHYDKVAPRYINNFDEPYTQEYTNYLNREFEKVLHSGNLGNVTDICCGSGEALSFLSPRITRGIGVDVSMEMLTVARRRNPNPNLLFVQADATMLPLADCSFDHVITWGGVHHVNDRLTLFREIFRILKPGGRFIFREPLNDFFLWRALREVIYRASPALEASTEKPLQYAETREKLLKAGFELTRWTGLGFLGFFLFLNTHVLILNHIFRYLPGYKSVVRATSRFDHFVTQKVWNDIGLQVVGLAEKPVRQN